MRLSSFSLFDKTQRAVLFLRSGGLETDHHFQFGHSAVELLLNVGIPCGGAEVNQFAAYVRRSVNASFSFFLLKGLTEN
jgi:hypothetical protein